MPPPSWTERSIFKISQMRLRWKSLGDWCPFSQRLTVVSLTPKTAASFEAFQPMESRAAFNNFPSAAPPLAPSTVHLLPSAPNDYRLSFLVVGEAKRQL